MQIKGDLTVRRTLIADRRVDNGLRASVITGTEALTRHSAYWQSLSAAAPQDCTLPDATTLPGTSSWTVVVYASGAETITVKNNSTGDTIKAVAPGEAYQFVLLDNSDADGTWHVVKLDDPGEVVASRYTSTHDATTDWGSAAGGYYTITITAATHGRGTSPNAEFYETDGTDQIAVMPDRVLVAANGDVSFRVPEDPDLRYAGKVVII